MFKYCQHYFMKNWIFKSFAAYGPLYLDTNQLIYLNLQGSLNKESIKLQLMKNTTVIGLLLTLIGNYLNTLNLIVAKYL